MTSDLVFDWVDLLIMITLTFIFIIDWQEALNKVK